MTLNGVALILDFSPNSIASVANNITVVEDELIMSEEYRLLLLAKTDPPCSAVSLRQLSYLLHFQTWNKQSLFICSIFS